MRPLSLGKRYWQPWVAGAIIVSVVAGVVAVLVLLGTNKPEEIAVSPDLHAPRSSEERRAVAAVNVFTAALTAGNTSAACGVLAGRARDAFRCRTSRPRIPTRYRRPSFQRGESAVSVLDGIMDEHVTTGVALRSGGPSLILTLRRTPDAAWHVVRLSYGAFL